MAGLLDEDFHDPLGYLPEEPYERALALMNALVDYVAGGSLSTDSYVRIRKQLLADPSIRHLLPQILIKCRDTSAMLTQGGSALSGFSPAMLTWLLTWQVPWRFTSSKLGKRGSELEADHGRVGGACFLRLPTF